ncbi:DUF4350 domain-containing protein [Demequina aestuarii]|uniref:DUF4350 domain-containing protein n=1 Tax=Demequina aestuarii TaxID=327095 RepID=UPI000780ADB1|nr:DUF4350 domain-containing protein [Demequina aestuarii]
MSTASVDSARTRPAPSSPGFSRADDDAGLVTRARRRPVVLSAAALFVVLIVTLIWTSRPEDYTPLSTDNATPSGTRALAQVLRAQGVDVRQIGTMADARIDSPGTTTLAVAGTEPMAEYQIDALIEYPGDLVLIDPSQSVVDRIAPALSVEPSLDAAPVAAACEDPDAVAAESVRVADTGLAGDPGPDGMLCFPNDYGSHAYAVVDDGDRRVTLIASWPLVTNEHLAEDGNAALALRALGRHETVVWYVGDLFDPSTLTWSDGDGDGDNGADGAVPPTEIEANPDFLPPGTGSAVYLLALTALVAAWWRARRFGPLVREPLPVIVRASEATRGRARLYRRSRASGRATAALRATAAARMARRLGVPRAAGRTGLVPAVARAANRDESDVDRILYGAPPTDDSTMMSIIQELDTLESEVHRP